MQGQVAIATCGPTLLIAYYQKRNISADDMYSTICVEWAVYYFRLGLTLIHPTVLNYVRKSIFTFSLAAHIITKMYIAHYRIAPNALTDSVRSSE